MGSFRFIKRVAEKTLKGIFVFDFDGTLIDSVQIKKTVFIEFLRPLFNNRDLGIRILINLIDDGRSRSMIIGELFDRRLLVDKLNLDLLLADLDKMLTEAVIDAALFKGVSETLDILVSQGFGCALASRTPKDSLLQVLQSKFLRAKFLSITGADSAKDESILSLQKVYRIPLSKIAMVGDDRSDALAASKTGCVFIDVTPAEMRMNGFPSAAELIHRLSFHNEV